MKHETGNSSMTLSVPDDATNIEERIRRHLPHQPAQALQMLPQVACNDTRMTLAIQIARSWPHTDINTAWNAVARSSLNATEKQVIFNELWG